MSRKFFQGNYWFFEETEKLGEPASPAWGAVDDATAQGAKSIWRAIW